MFGAAIYYHIEHGEEKISRAEQRKAQIAINGGWATKEINSIALLPLYPLVI